MHTADNTPRTPKRTRVVPLKTDLESFVASHGTHGSLAGTFGRLPVNGGYRHRIVCSCGATFLRYTTRSVARRSQRKADLLPVASENAAPVELASV